MATYQGWLTIRPTSGSDGTTNITVSAPQNTYPYEREVSFKAHTSTQSVNFKVKQNAAIVTGGTYLTVFYNVTTNTTAIPIINRFGPNFRAIKVNDGDFEKVTNSYRFNRLGLNKIEYLLRDTDTSRIPYSAFYDIQNSVSVVIPDLITDVMDSAFYGNINLSSVTLSNNTERIEARAFQNCQSLQTISLPNGLAYLEPGVFESCTILSSIQLPGTLIELGNSVFRGCTSLEEIVIPSSVTTYGTSIFENCSSLSAATLPNNIATIRFGMFMGCTNLNNLIIPSSVTSIGLYVFAGCRSLTTLYAYPITPPTTNPDMDYIFGPDFARNGVLHYPAGSDYSSWLTYLGNKGWTGVADL